MLGVPFMFALLAKDQIITATALALIASLGDLVPPTALAGIFAGQVVGEENYFKILKACVVPAIAIALWGVAFIGWAGPLASWLRF